MLSAPLYSAAAYEPMYGHHMPVYEAAHHLYEPYGYDLQMFNQDQQSNDRFSDFNNYNQRQQQDQSSVQ